jgi:hypothetical protein
MFETLTAPLWYGFQTAFYDIRTISSQTLTDYGRLFIGIYAIVSTIVVIGVELLYFLHLPLVDRLIILGMIYLIGILAYATMSKLSDYSENFTIVLEEICMVIAISSTYAFYAMLYPLFFS